jgi:hypothetical protein
MTATPIFADLTNRILVASSKASAEKRIDSPSRPGHLDKLYWAIQPLLQSASPTNEQPYEEIDAANYSITVVLVAYVGGTVLSGPMNTWSVDETRKVGYLDLNTAAMVTAMTSVTELRCVLEFKFDDGANVATTIRQEIYVNKSYLTASTPSELPLTAYFTREEVLALFVRFANNPAGATVELKSPDGTRTINYGVNDDGSENVPS